jgi:uncharacterized protein DUF4105
LKRLLFLLLALISAPAFAGIAEAPADTLQVSLITYGPGDIYWERFGHDAVELRDPASGEAIAFNYGVFDFDEAGFLLNFARGIMRYRMDALPTSEDVQFYVSEGRNVTRQRLAFTPAQTEDLRRFLFWNIQPRNTRYNYNYYLDNCATRVRDALDHALGGQLNAALAKRPGGMTFRQQTARLMSNQTWLMLGMDLGLGPFADQPMDALKESFLPMVLRDEIAGINVADGAGGSRPLVQSTEVLAKATIEQPPVVAPELGLPLFGVGLALAVLLMAAGAYREYRAVRIFYGVVATVWLLFAGVAGLVMLGLWTLTQHQSAWANANLLIYQPLAFLLLPAVWRGYGAFSARIVWACVILAVLALVLHALPGYAQRNFPWVGLGLPVWLALAASRFRR